MARRRITTFSLPKGRFSTIVVDSPWPYLPRTDDGTRAALVPSPTMSLAEI